MKVLRINKKTLSKVELARLIIGTYCSFSGINIGETDMEVLAYFAVYGFKRSTKVLILNSKILNCKGSLENTMSKLRKLGLIERDRDGLNVMPKALDIDTNSMGIIIKLENV